MSSPRPLVSMTIGMNPRSPKGLVPAEIQDQIYAGIQQMKSVLSEQGVENTAFLFQDITTEEKERLLKEVTLKHYDFIVVGNGIRGPPHWLPLFEWVINLIHEHGDKQTRIIFNTQPTDITGIERWFEKHQGSDGQVTWTVNK